MTIDNTTQPTPAASEFEEDGDPSVGVHVGAYAISSVKKPRWRHTADTRRLMAYAIVGVTLLLYAYLTVAAVYGWIQTGQFTQVLAALAPLQALAAATIGFFFGRQKGER